MNYQRARTLGALPSITAEQAEGQMGSAAAGCSNYFEYYAWPQKFGELYT